jgi:hypothetical protein
MWHSDLRLDDRWIEIQFYTKAYIFLVSTLSRPALSGVLSLGLKRLGLVEVYLSSLIHFHEKILNYVQGQRYLLLIGASNSLFKIVLILFSELHTDIYKVIQFTSELSRD